MVKVQKKTLKLTTIGLKKLITLEVSIRIFILAALFFGLPHNYFSKEENKVMSENVIGSTHDRRASPLFVHVHECSPNNYVLITLILRSEFLSPEEKIKAGDREVSQIIEWQVIDDFLDGFRGPKDNKTKDPYSLRNKLGLDSATMTDDSFQTLHSPLPRSNLRRTSPSDARPLGGFIFAGMACWQSDVQNPQRW